jgi:hypothetical protein
MGTLQQRVLDCRCQCFKGGEVLEMRTVFFHFLPALFDRMVIRRVAWPLEDLKPGGLLGAEGSGLGAGVILGPILNQDHVWRGLLHHTREKGHVGGGVKATFLPLIQEASGEVISQPEDVIALAFAGRLALGLLAASGPGVCERAPLRERGCIANPQQGLSLFRETQNLWPRRGAPGLPLACIEMLGDEGGFWIATAQVLESLGTGEDVGEDPKALVNQRLDHGRAPAGAAETSLDRSCVKEGGEEGLWRRGQFGRAPRGLVSRCPLKAIATAPSDPGEDGLLVDAQDQCDLRETLAVPDGEDGEEILDLA